MKYLHIARFVAETPWAILRSKLDEIEAILAFHMDGGKFTAEEIRARIGEPTEPAMARRGAVAVLPLRGVIAHRIGSMQEMSGGMSTEAFSQMFRQALADPSVSAIVLDVNSPGGTIAGVTELAGEIFAARGTKPIIAQVNALAASAAYWIASAADQIVATPSGEIGAIGVITSHLDVSKAEEAEGVTRTVFSAGKFKAEGAGPLSDEAKAAIQARVDEAYGVMTADIARGRGVKPNDIVNGFGQGRVVSAKMAKSFGMIDKIATMDQTLSRLVGRKGADVLRASVDEEMLDGDVLHALKAGFDARRRLLL